jgi:hypothetical protein
MTLQEQLKKTPVDGSVEEMMLAYNSANREVAILCNHQVLDTCTLLSLLFVFHAVSTHPLD